MIPSPAPPGSPTGWMLPREFAFAARPNGDHFSEGSLSTAPPGSPTAYISPRDFAFTAWLTGRPFSEGLRARHRQAPRPLIFLRGNLLSPLGHPVATSPRDFRARLPDRLHFSEGFCFHRSAHRLSLLRGTSSPAPPGSPTTYIFPRDFALTAWLTGRPFSKKFRARLRQAPRPLAFLRGILLSSLGSPVPPLSRDFEPGSLTAYLFPRDFAFTAWLIDRPFSKKFPARLRQAPRPLTFFRGILLPSLGSPVTTSPRDSSSRTARPVEVVQYVMCPKGDLACCAHTTCKAPVPVRSPKLS